MIMSENEGYQIVLQRRLETPSHKNPKNFIAPYD
jgi:hypothetical protein